MTRAEVFAVLHEERQHQEAKWGTLAEHPHEVGGWLTIVRHYLASAEQAWTEGRGDAAALAEVRKLAALAVACLEQHGGGSEPVAAPGTPRATIEAFVRFAESECGHPAYSSRGALESVRAWVESAKNELVRLGAARDKLQKFKDYTHARLDDAGVPVDPESAHKAEGCRIGGRLDELIAERDRLRALLAGLDAGDRSLARHALRVQAQLEAENEKLRAALKPFAELAGVDGLTTDDSVQLLAFEYAPGTATVGDCRRAREVLSAPAPSGG